MSPSIHEAEWTQLIVPDSGRKYFYNVTTGESRWDIRNQGGPYSQGGPYNAKHKGGPQFKSNTRPMHPSMQIADSGPYFVSNKPMHPMANGTRPNRHYHTLNDAIDYTHHQQRARPQPYEFMTPPRERRSRSQILSPQGHSDPFQRQLNQLILKPPHQRDPVARNHRKSHSVSNTSDISTESLKRELIDAYHKQISTDPGHSNQRKNRANNAPVNDSHVVNLLQSMEMEKTEKYTKDYVGLSKAYKLMETYRLNHRGTCPACLFCNKARRLDKVLFPCEHVCVCSSCLERTEPKRCPLCKDVIRRVLDCNGHEHDDYWRWVEEVSSGCLLIAWDLSHDSSHNFHLQSYQSYYANVLG
jgi:hypothetical protein